MSLSGTQIQVQSTRLLCSGSSITSCTVMFVHHFKFSHFIFPNNNFLLISLPDYYLWRIVSLTYIVSSSLLSSSLFFQHIDLSKRCCRSRTKWQAKTSKSYWPSTSGIIILFYFLQSIYYLFLVTIILFHDVVNYNEDDW